MTMPTSVEMKTKLIASSMDLTLLNDSDSEADIRALCARATGPAGSVAAICVWPRFAALARSLLPAHIDVAAVANFPDGSLDVARAVADSEEIIKAGAQEIDVVLPYHALQQGQTAEVLELLKAVRTTAGQCVLKVILETGELATPALIALASDLSMEAGADFLKTSTGKSKVSATAAAARVMLERIVARGKGGRKVGFKASGGVRTLEEAMVYAELQAAILGQDSVIKTRFRIGASSLLDNLEAMIGHGDTATVATGY